MNTVNWTGHVLNDLTVICRSPSMRLSSGGNAFWQCLCKCGKTIEVDTSTLRRGKQVSCGCRTAEIISKKITKHGMTKSPEYGAWIELRRRCENENRPSFKGYIDRGITVCKRWDDSFEAFYADMGDKPSPRHSIDRINNDLGYWCGRPECDSCGQQSLQANCRWATPFEQQGNRRVSLLITYQGRTLHLREWSRVTGINRIALQWRYHHNWPPERMLSPVQKKQKTLPR